MWKGLSFLLTLAPFLIFLCLQKSVGKKKKRFQESQPIGTFPREEQCVPAGRGLGTRVALGLQWGHSILKAIV